MSTIFVARFTEIDTAYVHTYTVFMNITLAIDEAIVERAREKLRAVGKSVNQEIRDHLARLAGKDDEQLARDIRFLEQTAGLGDSNGWKWNRDELYERR